MGLFLLFKKNESAPKESEALVIPSMEEQKIAAEKDLGYFLELILNEWNATDGDFKCEKFRIAGISFHCTKANIGMIRGATFNQANNPKDKTAVGIVSLDNKGQQQMLGYIAKEDKKRYRELANGAEQLPFIGFICQYQTEDGKIGINGNN